MYEWGRPLKWHYQPVGEALGLGMHESQSLIIEMQVCRSRESMNWVAPLVRKSFMRNGHAWFASNLLLLSTRVSRNFIRVDADEVTYPAHVIFRYRLERAMVEGKILPEDLP